MTIFMSQFFMLAEEAAKKEQGGGMMQMLFLFGPPLLFLFVLQTFFGRSDAKDKAKRDEMVSGLKKNDPVVTIGGILGSVVSVSEDKQTVTIKVEDNTRLKMQASAIREVTSRADKDSGKS